MNNIQKIYKSRKGVKHFAASYIDYLKCVLGAIDLEEISSFINLLEKARDSQHTIYFIGNGGSAATASHFANDLAIGTRSKTKPFRVMSLTDNNAVLTAIGNDFGYDEIFSRQLEIYLRPGDVVVAISVSGNSPNVLKAIGVSKELGATTVSLTGFDGGRLKSLTDINVHIPSEKGEYGPVEDAYMIINHIIGNLFFQISEEV